MSFKHITSRDNPIVKHLKKLAENARERRAEGKTLLDGVHLIEAYLQVFGEPELIIISAGFDAHREDDLGQMGLVEDDYAWMTKKLKEVASQYSQGRIVSCLEGGYNLSALGRSVVAHVKALADI